MINTNKTIVFVIPFFHAGGVERWVSYAVSALKNRGVSVKIFCTGALTIKDSFYCDDVIVESFSWFDVIKYLYRHDVITVSALTRPNLIISIVSKVFGRNHISSVHLSLGKKKTEKLWKHWMRVLFHWVILSLSKNTIAVSEGVAAELISIKSSADVSQLYNPCFFSEDISPPRTFDKSSPLKFVSAGRLHSQKRFDLLIEAFVKSYSNFPRGSTLTIWGEGDDREMLENMISPDFKELIFLPGATNHLFNEFRKADIFVLSSEYEGFGNVLAEALANGCKCLSVDIPHGPSEILDKGRFGILVDFELECLSIGMVEASNPPSISQIYSMSLKAHLYKFTVESFGEGFAKLLEKIG